MNSSCYCRRGEKGLCSNLHINLISDTSIVNFLCSRGCFPCDHLPTHTHFIPSLKRGLEFLWCTIPQLLCLSNLVNERLGILIIKDTHLAYSKPWVWTPEPAKTKQRNNLWIRFRNVLRLNITPVLLLELFWENAETGARAVKHLPGSRYRPEPSGCLCSSGWGAGWQFHCNSLLTAKTFQKEAQNICIAHLR